MTPSIRELLAGAREGQAVTVQGWVRTARHAKACTFLALVDGSTQAVLQCVCDPTLPGYETGIRKIIAGAAVAVDGRLVASPGQRQAWEVHVDALRLVGGVDEDYPLQKKAHSFEFLRTVAHLRPRTNTMGAVMRVRNALAMAIHDFFQRRGFQWVHTPIITASDCEGAGQLFRVTTLDADAPPRSPDGAVDFTRDFFGTPTQLTVSGQLEGEALALALGRVYTFGPTFRAENSNTARHLAEFWMVEPEMAFCDLDGNRALAEAFIKTTFAAVAERCADELAFFAERIDPDAEKRLRHVIDTPFEHLTYTDAIRRLEGASVSFEYPVSWGLDLQSEHERWLTEAHVGRPVVVTDYPADIKAFYMYQNDDGRTVRGMDVLVPGVGELIGGAQREDRADHLADRMRAMRLDPDAYRWYIDLRRFGGVPHSGFGLGFERALLFITGMANIRDVIPFPRFPGHADF